VETIAVCGWYTDSGLVSSVLSRNAMTIEECSWRTLNLTGGYCHGPSAQAMVYRSRSYGRVEMLGEAVMV